MRTSIRILTLIFFLCIILIGIQTVYYTNLIFKKIKVTTISELNRWKNKNLSYIEEPIRPKWMGQEWKMAPKTYKDRGGDCEDLATFNFEMLKRMGYEPIIISVWFMERGQKLGHAFTVIKEGKYYSIFSNLNYEKTSYTSKIEIINGEYPTWTNYSICKRPLTSICKNRKRK